MNTKNFYNKEAMALSSGKNEIFITAKYGDDISFQIFSECEQKKIIFWDDINISGLPNKNNQHIINHIRATYFQQ